MEINQTVPLVLIPGFMLDETLWDEVITDLPASQPVYRASLREGQSITEMAHLIAAKAPSQFVAVGFSLGGYVARALAALYPERTVGLILVATSMREDSLQQQAAKQNAVSAQAQLHFRGLGRHAIARALRADHAQDNDWINRIRQMGERLGFAVFARQSLLNRATPAGQKITCPTLIISASEDQLRSVEEAEELKQHIPQAQTCVIEQSGHMLPLEQPQLLGKTMMIWLQEQQ